LEMGQRGRGRRRRLREQGEKGSTLVSNS
jgi:hypothetical protein